MGSDGESDQASGTSSDEVQSPTGVCLRNRIHRRISMEVPFKKYKKAFVCVCVCVCVCVNIYIHTNVCIYMCMYISNRINAYLKIFMRTNAMYKKVVSLY